MVGDKFEIRARRFVIATGSTPAVPPIAGLDSGPYLTNDTIFDLTERPKHLIVIGGGPIGLEMAQAFRRLGSKVTVLGGRRSRSPRTIRNAPRSCSTVSNARASSSAAA